MIDNRRIPENGDPWKNWVTRELKYLHDEVKQQREDLKAQREEAKAQKKIQRNIVMVLDQHGRLIAGLTTAVQNLQKTTSEMRQEMREGFDGVGRVLQAILKRLP